VPAELEQAQKAAARLKNTTYIEVKEESAYGHGALARTTDVWGPKLRAWLENVRQRR